jgi:mycothiol synthase
MNLQSFRTTTAIGDGLPSGVTVRPFDLEGDVDGFVAVIHAANRADDVDWLVTPDQFRTDVTNRADFDPALDILVAEVDGEIVAGAEAQPQVRDDIAVHHVRCWVHPAHRRRGIGRHLLARNEARSREVARGWERDREHVLDAWADEHEYGALALLDASGYERIRYGFMMLRPLDEPIPDAPLPDGIELRPVRPEDHDPIWAADSEAFLDHWGAHQRTEEDRIAWFSMPGMDTSLWKVAWDGDEVVGSTMNAIWSEENATLGVSRGWLEHISVRRAWRKRGIASALIAESLRELRRRGVSEAALGVDGQNLSGALRLYESLGFRKHRMSTAFRKAL